MTDTNEYLSLKEASEYLNKSSKTLSRYIKAGLLTPERITSQRGTSEYRFKKSELDTLLKDPKTQDTQDRTSDRTREGEDRTKDKTPDRTDTPDNYREIINLLRENQTILKEQLKTKDEQIKDLGSKIDQLLERNKEGNILISHLQNKLLLEDKKPDLDYIDEDLITEQSEPKEKRKSFFERIFNL